MIFNKTTIAFSKKFILWKNSTFYILVFRVNNLHILHEAVVRTNSFTYYEMPICPKTGVPLLPRELFIHIATVPAPSNIF